MLEEIESELAMRRHELSLETERLLLSKASFVEDLVDKHQLFESLFASNSDNIVSDSETSLNDTSKSNMELWVVYANGCERGDECGLKVFD